MEKYIITAAVALVVLIGGLTFYSAFQTNTQTCTVESKDRTTNANGQSDARIYTTDCGVLQVEDSLLHGKFNSADTYAKIKVGQTYDFKTQGVRIGLFSMFPNIIEATPV